MAKNLGQISVDKFQKKIKLVSKKIPELQFLLTTLFNKPHPKFSFEVQIVNKSQMTKLNKAYRNKNKTTDVLSFESPKAIRQIEPFLGSIVICDEVCQTQALKMRHDYMTEFQILVTHGYLHLLGFDHETSAIKAKKMAKIETRLLELLQIHDPGLINRVKLGTSKK